MVIVKFEPTGLGNEIIQCEGYYISYRATKPDSPISMLCTMMMQIHNQPCAAEEYKGETALKADDEPWLILQGDYRKEYAALASQGYDICKEFYLSQKDEARSDWSTDDLVVELEQ